MGGLSAAPAAVAPTDRGWWIFARREDVHCVVFHVVTLVAYAVAFWLWLHPEVAGIEGPWSAAAFVGAAAFLLGWISGIDVGVNFHNHTHRRIFKHALLNRWGGRLWTFSGGWPSFFWQHAHVKVHHANLLGDADWTLPKRRADGGFEIRDLFCHENSPICKGRGSSKAVVPAMKSCAYTDSGVLGRG